MPLSIPPALLRPVTLLRLSVTVALATIALKGAAGWLTQSMGLIADALESLVNLASALFALVMIQVAGRPADAEHPYGHHKAEYFASGFEGLLIVVAALVIGWAAVGRLLSPRPIEQLGWGLALVVAGSALNAGLAALMFRGARLHRSIALEADARHLMTDVWTSVGVLVGLVAVVATGWLWLDPLLALGVAANIVREGGRLMWRSVQGLMDHAVPPQEQTAIQRVLDGFGAAQGGAVRFDDIVTRGAAQRLFADLHMHVPGDWSLQHAADLRDAVEQALMDAVPGLRVTIQLLPLTMEARAVQQDERRTSA